MRTLVGNFIKKMSLDLLKKYSIIFLKKWVVKEKKKSQFTFLSKQVHKNKYIKIKIKTKYQLEKLRENKKIGKI